MPYTKASFIELDRRFVELKNDRNREDAAYDSYGQRRRWGLQFNELSWADLLERPVVVILGEAGGGKTWELRHRAETSIDEGKVGFFLALDRLVNETELPFESGGQQQAFLKWQNSEENARFFLDSVDEAKFRKSEDFHLALNRFKAAIGSTRLERAQIVISSRITEWYPHADYAAVRAAFPIAQVKGKKSPMVVHILPLDRDGVCAYARQRWGTEGEAFTGAIGATFAWDLARRPADVEDLYGFWSKERRFGSLTETLDSIIDQQLQRPSKRDRVDPLTLEKARSGAEHLAAATLFCRRFTFSVPGDEIDDAHSLSVYRCLNSAWRETEIRALLNRAVFDAASHGRIRFHHRRIAEFLAARWLRKLMDSGCAIEALESLLVSTVRGRRILRPSLAPAAAWLCGGTQGWNIEVFRWIIECRPEILLQSGDPDQLTLKQRERLFDALLERNSVLDRHWWTEDRASLSRLAHPCLEDRMNELLTSTGTPRGLRSFALDLAAAGKLKNCGHAVLQAALSDIKRKVERGENSPRWTLRRSDQEIGARRWIASKLEDSARGLYQTPQESEISGKFRIDIRVATPGISPTSIEIKVLDMQWTLPDLIEALESQLAATYLADDNIHYGVLLLIQFEKRRWRDESGRIVDLDEMLAILRKKQNSIVTAGGSVRGLEIVHINFEEPKSWRKQEENAIETTRVPGRDGNA